MERHQQHWKSQLTLKKQTQYNNKTGNQSTRERGRGGAVKVTAVKGECGERGRVKCTETGESVKKWSATSGMGKIHTLP